MSQFTTIAEVLAQIIVDDLPCPEEEKLIQPVHLGGVAGTFALLCSAPMSVAVLTLAGGAKYISHGIFFKFAIDAARLYGGDEFAMKAIQVCCDSSTRAPLPLSFPDYRLPRQHEIKGLTAYINYSINSRFPKMLHFPLMTTIGTPVPTPLPEAAGTAVVIIHVHFHQTTRATD